MSKATWATVRPFATRSSVHYGPWEKGRTSFISSEQERIAMPNPIDPRSPAIDPETIETLRMLQEDGGPDLVSELFEMFYADVPLRFTELKGACASADAGKIASVAHGLKSASANIGCLGFSELCRQLEAMGRKQDIQSAPEFVGYLEQEYDRVQQAFRSQYAAAA